MTASGVCSACGGRLYADDRFCVGCGAAAGATAAGSTRALTALATGTLSQVRPCRECRQAIYADDRFCSSCGADQQEGAPDDAPAPPAPPAAPLRDADAGAVGVVTGLVCQGCGAGLFPDDNFCVACGTVARQAAASVPPSGGTRIVAALQGGAPTPETCASCGTPTIPGDRFCQQCGAPAAFTSGAGQPGALPSPVPDVGAAREPDRRGSGPAEVVISGRHEDAWTRVRRRLEQAFLGELDIAGELGRGGMAAVFLAHDVALDRKVAIKVMAPGLLTGAGMVDRFKREAVTVAGLRHPHIVSIHAVRHVDDLHCIVMDYIDGNSLEHVLQAAGCLPFDVTRAILHQVGSALAYAHRRGIVHRDVKPANILLDSEGNAIVMDFGIAKVAEQPSHTQTGAAVGTPAYMSPEQCYAAEVTSASDQYSLGVVAYEMLTGRPPFEGTAFAVMQAHTQTPPPPVKTARPECPPALEAAVHRMLAKRAADRFPSLPDALEALGARPLAAGDPLHATLAQLATTSGASGVARAITPVSPIPGTHAGTRAPARRPRWPLVAGAAGVATLAALAFALWRTNGALPAVDAAATPAADSALATRPDEPSLPPPAPETPLPAVPRTGSVAIAAPRRALQVGEAMTLSAAVTDSTGERLPDARVEWRSSDPSRLEVSPAGQVTAHLPGRARITAIAGAWRGTVDVAVGVPPVVRLTLTPPAGPLVAGRTVEIRATAERERPGVGNPPLTWRSSNPAVATIAASDSLRAEVSLLGEGEATIAADADGVTGTTALVVRAALSLELSRNAVTFDATADGTPPGDESVAITITGDRAQPAVRAPEYVSGASGWLTAVLQGANLMLRASPRGVPAGAHRAQVAVSAGSQTRTVTVDFRVAPARAVDPVAAARPEIEALLDAYQRALNSGDAAGVTRAFPSIPKRDLDALMSRRVSDRVEILLRGTSLKPGAEPGTMEGEVSSGMLGERAGRIARFVYVFERSAAGWIIKETRELR